MHIHSEFAGHRLNTADVSPRGLAPSWGGSRVGDWLAFFIAATIWIKIRIVGELLGSDILVLAAFPFLLVTRLRRLNSPFAKRYVILSLVGLVSLAVTDLWRETPFIDWTRGWSRNGLLLVTFCVLFALLRGRPRRVAYFAIGLVLQGYLAFFFAPNQFAPGEPWKFGVGVPTSLTIILVGMYFDRNRGLPRWSLLACLIAGALNVFMNFRSLGGICLTAALVLWLARGLRFSGRKLPQPILILMTIISIIGVIQLYSTLASRGILGQEAYLKNSTQQGRYGMIGGGRSEFFGSFLAIADSPFLGHGSWAKDPKYRGLAKQLRAEAGYKDQGLDATGPDMDLIPTHSHLFAAWVEGGFAASLLWFWVFYRATRSLLVVSSLPQWAALRTFACLSLLWDILFSPLGGGARYGTIFNIVIVCSPDVFSALSQSIGRTLRDSADLCRRALEPDAQQPKV